MEVSADLLDEDVGMLMQVQLWIGLCDCVQMEGKAASPLISQALGHVGYAGFLHTWFTLLVERIIPKCDSHAICTTSRSDAKLQGVAEQKRCRKRR